MLHVCIIYLNRHAFVPEWFTMWITVDELSTLVEIMLKPVNFINWCAIHITTTPTLWSIIYMKAFSVTRHMNSEVPSTSSNESSKDSRRRVSRQIGEYQVEMTSVKPCKSMTSSVKSKRRESSVEDDFQVGTTNVKSRQ